MKPVLILLFISGLIMLMFSVKLLLVFAFRQNNYFLTKLSHSFFFYDENKINKETESRLKNYYRNSNIVNKAFYSSFLLLFFVFFTSWLMALVEKANLYVSSYWYYIFKPRLMIMSSYCFSFEQIVLFISTTGVIIFLILLRRIKSACQYLFNSIAEIQNDRNWFRVLPTY